MMLYEVEMAAVSANLTGWCQGSVNLYFGMVKVCNESGTERFAARVLVVEDDPATRCMIADDLSDRGYDICLAENGEEALAYLDEARPDVIVLDLMMPGRHGWSFLECYRNKTAGESIPVVVVSAARAVPQSYDSAGVRAFLSKPFHLEELAGLIASLTKELPALTTAGV